MPVSALMELNREVCEAEISAVQSAISSLSAIPANFEGICEEYLIRLAKTGRLPLVPYSIGKWWGNNPAIKAQDDVDILLLDKKGERAVFVECKFTPSPMPHGEYEDLKTATLAFPGVKEKNLWFISKSGYEDSVVRSAKEDGAVLLTVDDLFEDGLI